MFLWFKELATREFDERTNLKYISKNLKVGVILVGKDETWEEAFQEEVEGMFSGFSFTLEEYFTVYYGSNNILLDNEHMWPVENYVSQLIEYSKEPYTEINGINLT